MPDYETSQHDVLVIGAGGAGLRAAIEASAAGVSVGLICKSLLGKAHTVMAEGGTVRAADLDLVASDAAASLNIQDARRSAERSVIDRAIAQVNGNISKAAALLGVSRPTLYNLIEDHGIVVHHARDLHVAHDKGRKA